MGRIALKGVEVMLVKISKALANQKGFTLIEMLTVLVIIGIIGAIAVPRIMGVMMDAKEKACAANIKAIETAVSAYLLQHHEAPAKVEVLMQEGYIDPNLTCPVNGESYKENPIDSDTGLVKHGH
jgi:prepilin-type N-terminal cleavage/methylation domain-containing protein